MHKAEFATDTIDFPLVELADQLGNLLPLFRMRDLFQPQAMQFFF